MPLCGAYKDLHLVVRCWTSWVVVIVVVDFVVDRLVVAAISRLQLSPVQHPPLKENDSCRLPNIWLTGS